MNPTANPTTKNLPVSMDHAAAADAARNDALPLSERVCDLCQHVGTIGFDPVREYEVCRVCRKVYTMHVIVEEDEFFDDGSDGEIGANVSRVTQSVCTPYYVDEKLHMGVRRAVAHDASREARPYIVLHRAFLENKRFINRYARRVRNSESYVHLALQYHTLLHERIKRDKSERVARGEIKQNEFRRTVPLSIYLAWVDVENAQMASEDKLLEIARLCGLAENKMQYLLHEAKTLHRVYNKRRETYARFAANRYATLSHAQEDRVERVEKMLVDAQAIGDESKATVSAALVYCALTHGEEQGAVLEDIEHAFGVKKGTIIKFFKEKVQPLVRAAEDEERAKSTH